MGLFKSDAGFGFFFDIAHLGRDNLLIGLRNQVLVGAKLEAA